MKKQSVQKHPRFSPDLFNSLTQLAAEHEESPTQFIIKCVKLVSSLNKLQGMERKKAEGYTVLEAIKHGTHQFVDTEDII